MGSPEALLEAGRALAEATGEAGILFGHVTDTAQNWRLFAGLYAQTGAAFDLPDGGPPKIDTDAALRVVTLMTRLFDGRTNPNNLDYNGALAAFSSGRGGMAMLGEWELPTLKKSGMELGAAPFPQIFEKPAVYTDSHSFVLPHQDRPDPARRREAHRYVARILKQSLTWAGAGHIPAYQPVLAEPEYAALDPQSSYAAAAKVAVLDPPNWFAGAGSNFQNRMCQPLQSALLGDTTPEKAVRQMVGEADTLLRQPNPVARPAKGVTDVTTTAPLGAEAQTSPPPASGDGRRRALGRIRTGNGLVSVLPFLLVFGLFLVWPIVQGLWTSFTDSSLALRDTSFVGFDNYTEAFGAPDVWSSLGNTVFFTVISSVPLVLVALAMALLVHSGLAGQWAWRLSFFAPYLLPVTVVTMIWTWLYQPELGVANQLLDTLGMAPVGWLSDESVAMWSVAALTVWWTVGFNFLLYLAALQSMPTTFDEAAALDGAGAWRRLWSITLPQLRRTTGLVTMLQVLASLKVFDQIYILTKGGPNGSTRPVLEYVYDVGFTGYRLGYASAVSYLFFALIVLVSLVQLRLFRRED